uniref:Uncharacterized protein n=1 Tax=uncultured marine microorganism HF4000_097M14 TaxID=455520 RepID=B3T1X3_9ZZZZ|nr:hypothetical protein ALOHA_HF4000097M14ctg1g26 [uncultured marine microorganism HF4000_097M14]
MQLFKVILEVSLGNKSSLDPSVRALKYFFAPICHLCHLFSKVEKKIILLAPWPKFLTGRDSADFADNSGLRALESLPLF